MRTEAEIRARLLDHLAQGLRRPMMCGGPNVIRERFDSLIFADENDEAYEKIMAGDRFARYFGSGWVAGPFWWKFGGKLDRYDNEAGSVYAEMAYHFHFDCQRRIFPIAWS